MKLLDCTLRDGGYYTNWDFDEDLVDIYCKSMELLPIEYIEVGYRSIALSGYLGKYYYCPLFVLEKLKQLMPSKKLAIILNEKDIRVDHIPDLLEPIKSYVTLIRIAVDPKNFKRALELAKSVKKLGFEVGFNVMYMSNWKEDPSFLDMLKEADNFLDYFYMVDSFGGILPDEVREIIRLVKSKTNVSLGFHGHDNLHMALINSISALDEGCEIVDATITGMGRGAGNLKTELLLTYLESKKLIDFSFNDLGNIVSEFEELKKTYGWGSNLPYMFSGAHSLPQKDVMEWVGMNRYSLNSIINALNNKKLVVEDNLKLRVLKKEKSFKNAIILGGGKTVDYYKEAIIKYANSNEDFCLIHAGVKNIAKFDNLDCTQYYSLVGVEGNNFMEKTDFSGTKMKTFVLPPYPRKMGVSLSPVFLEKSKELKEINFTKSSIDSPFAVAIQLAIDVQIEELYLAGFDGYELSMNKNQFVLAQENQQIINDALNIEGMKIKSLTPTKYNGLDLESIYSLV